MWKNRYDVRKTAETSNWTPASVPAVRGPGTRLDRIAVLELPAAELAVAVHPGSHDDIAVTYGRLGAWVVEHALAVDGPVHETYLVGPRDTPAESDWRTEIGWPIFRLSGHDVAAVAP